MQKKPQDDREPVGEINYLNVVSQSIQKINEACLSGQNPRDAAENLITDLPDEWAQKIKDRLDTAEEDYNKILKYQQEHIKIGIAQSQKDRASAQILNAEKEYGRKVKKAVISLFHDMGLLVKTRKKIEEGYIDLYEIMGEKPPKDDDDDD